MRAGRVNRLRAYFNEFESGEIVIGIMLFGEEGLKECCCKMSSETLVCSSSLPSLISWRECLIIGIYSSTVPSWS